MAKKIIIKNMYSSVINVHGKPMQVGEELEVELDNEVKNLLRNGYLKLVAEQSEII